MDWLSKCVCGSKDSQKAFKKTKNNKKKQKKKDKNCSATTTVNATKYVINDSTLCNNEQQDTGEEPSISSLEECRQSEVHPVSEAKRQVKRNDNDEQAQSNNHVKFTESHDPEEYYDSLSDTSPIDTLHKDNFNHNPIHLNLFYDDNVKNLNTKPFVSTWSERGNVNKLTNNNTEVVKSCSENDFRSTVNSCSFVVPIHDENKDGRKAAGNRRINSMIPKPSAKSRGVINMRNNGNGILL